MKRIPYILSLLFLFASCENPEVGPTFYFYGADIKIFDSEGANVADDIPTEATFTGYTILYDEMSHTGSCSIHNEYGTLRIHMLSDRPVQLENNIFDVVVQSSKLFLDEQPHSLLFGLERHHKYWYEAKSLVFDGQSIAPDADGVFIIRLPKKE